MSSQGKRRKVAAGCIPMCKETGRVLVVLRCSWVDQPHTWSTIGGSLESGETCQAAVRRELREETQYSGSIVLIPVYTLNLKNLYYKTFVGLTPDEFHPMLNCEHDDAMWCELTNLPSPLHPGLIAMLNSKSDVLNDIRSKLIGREDDGQRVV